MRKVPTTNTETEPSLSQLHPFLVSHSRQPRAGQVRPSIWHDGLLISVLCFFLLGIGSIAIRTVYPQQNQQSVIVSATDTIRVEGAATSTATTLPSSTQTPQVAFRPSPAVTQTLTGKVATTTPAWLTDRYLPLPVNEKWIEVDITKQMLWAYEGANPVFSTTISTGSGVSKASLGKFRLSQKVALKLLTGPGYYLPDVPWVMVIRSDLMLHGAYWQDAWGTPSNYGSINLRVADAKWLYGWTNPVVPDGQQFVEATARDQGTWVLVH
jgi:lipoprotein-anchoring transpeptidase ErfK/SrfK